MKILITGGAGFVGSSFALHLKTKYPKARVVAFDNLRRRGSELNLSKFRETGIEFVHGDIRNPSDLNYLSNTWDVFIECSADASVLAGIGSPAAYVLETNLGGTINCLEMAKRSSGVFIFLSSSRVYSISPLRNLSLIEGPDKIEISEIQSVPGVSKKGVAENFPTDSSRSFYGTSKLASEYLIQEYVDTYKLNATINRCGVIAGPGQFGRTDQGVFALWVAHHFFKKPLKYTGFGGKGKQVRDLLHIDDLIHLVEKQIESSDCHRGTSFNVGGGPEGAVSLLELTRICQEITGNSVFLGSETDSSAVDIPWYVSDTSKAQMEFGWRPKKTIKDIVSDIHEWLKINEEQLKSLFS